MHQVFFHKVDRTSGEHHTSCVASVNNQLCKHTYMYIHVNMHIIEYLIRFSKCMMGYIEHDHKDLYSSLKFETLFTKHFN